MTVPNVTMGWCERRTKCEYCPEHIEKGTPGVRVFFWNKGGPDHKGFNVKKYYHPECWVAQGMDYLKMNPYVPKSKKPTLALSPEQRKRRKQLINQKASLEQLLWITKGSDAYTALAREYKEQGL